MSWKELGYLLVGLLVLQAVGSAGGEAARWGALVIVLGIGYVIVRVSHRQWVSRVETLRSSSAEDQEARLAALDEDERRLVRLHLGQIAPEDGLLDPRIGEEFSYNQTPRALRALTFLGSLAMAILPAVLLVLDKVAEDQRIWAALVATGFAASSFFQPRWWETEDSRVAVTVSGIQLRRPDGARHGLLWSEIAYVNVRPWLQAIDIVGHSGGRLRVWGTLQHLPRFMELVAGNLKRLEEPVE